jgi:flagellar biosynthesis protein FlhA
MAAQPTPNLPAMSGINQAKGALGGVLRGDTILAIGIITILVFMLIPIPTFLLDMGLAISILFSIFILMLTLAIKKPLEFSTFPTVLLISTALRLGLNIAATRLILAHGHEGTDSAGAIIQAFGGLIISGSYVVGGIVFAILIIINFVVITKGSGRIAEVAARFSLDAMPGKQMAIDSDLSSGLITEEEAKIRRKELEQESGFFGAMDGAAKFVRGDAIAALLIVFINIIGGIIIGTVQEGLSIGEAASTYTVLTIGEGLVSQVPALIVSISAGLLVSKAGVEGTADQALLDQFSRHPKAIAITAALMFVIACVPAVPFTPFAFMGAVFGGLAYVSWQRQEAEKEIKRQAALPPKPGTPGAKPAEEPISKALAMDIIRLELGYGLLSLVQGEGGNKLTDQIKGLRRQLAEDMGYVLPAVRIQDNLQLPANAYIVKIKEIESGRGEVRAGMLMAMDPTGAPITLPGEATVEPTFGLPAMWIDEQYREEAHFKGYTVVDAPTVITTHITEVVKDNMSDLLSYAETQKLLDEMPKEYQKLVADVIPGHMTVGGLQRILQNLVSERVSVRDLPTILEGISEATVYTKNIAYITEHVRSRLARQICDMNTNASGFVPLLTLSPEWEQAFAESLLGDGEDRQLAMAPTQLQSFITSVREAYEKFMAIGETPVLLTSPSIRPFVRSVIERFRPSTIVMSQNEIHPKAKIRTLGQV